MIYLDNAATTKPYHKTKQILVDYTYELFFNPSSVYLPAFEVKKQLKEAKQNLGKLLGCSEEELTFTSGATESNNLFLQGVVSSNKKEEFIFNLGEHSSVYEVANFIKSKGYTVHFAPLNKNGQVNVEELVNLVNENTKLVSVMHVSNETGVINNIKTITQQVKQKNPKTLVHSDGVQAFGKLPVNVKTSGVDAYTISSHKIHGPKGVGALYVKKGINVKALILGGGQEKNVRSGTENVAGIFAFCESANIITSNIIENYKRVETLKETFITALNALENVKITSLGKEYSPYILSVNIEGIKGEILVHMLQKEGVLASTGSSCSSNSKYFGNRVLQAMGQTLEEVKGNVRISFSEQTTEEEVVKASKIFVTTVNTLKKKIA